MKFSRLYILTSIASAIKEQIALYSYSIMTPILSSNSLRALCLIRLYRPPIRSFVSTNWRSPLKPYNPSSINRLADGTVIDSGVALRFRLLELPTLLQASLNGVVMPESFKVVASVSDSALLKAEFALSSFTSASDSISIIRRYWLSYSFAILLQNSLLPGLSWKWSVHCEHLTKKACVFAGNPSISNSWRLSPRSFVLSQSMQSSQYPLSHHRQR